MDLKQNASFNILLLGQTGVGKSTFINAFANYVLFKDFDRAKSIYWPCQIPVALSYLDDDFQPKIIKCGDDDNERSDCAGQSSTQTCKAYSIDANGKNITIIDTPGFGDTRGVEVDKRNIRNILTHLRKYKLLHTICILLKPNESRLTASFEYCLLEMFCHLPRNAVNNIMFMYTNTRGTFFKPGDTAVPLKVVLRKIEASLSMAEIPYGKDNVFCVDNEAFRCLVLYHEVDYKFSDNEFSNFKKSWKKSAKEFRRMVRYVTQKETNREQLNTEETIGVFTMNIKYNEMVQSLSKIIFIIQIIIFILKKAHLNRNFDNISKILNLFTALKIKYQWSSNCNLRNFNLQFYYIIFQFEYMKMLLIDNAARLHKFLKQNLVALFNDRLDDTFNKLLDSEQHKNGSNSEIWYGLYIIKNKYQDTIFKKFIEDIGITMEEGFCAIENVNKILNLDCWKNCKWYFYFDQIEQENVP